MNLSVLTFSSMHSAIDAALHPGTWDGVRPDKSGSVPAHKNACVRPVRKRSGLSPSFFDGRNSGMTVHAIILVEKAPVIANRLTTNLLSSGRSAIRSCKSKGNSLHLR